MTERQINELLANIISMYAPKFGRTITKKAAFSECGTIFEENIKDCIIAGVILSGTANRNPAFLLLWIEDDNIHLTASAKEGLIKQHTAERAVEAFKSDLARAKG